MGLKVILVSIVFLAIFCTNAFSEGVQDKSNKELIKIERVTYLDNGQLKTSLVSAAKVSTATCYSISSNKFGTRPISYVVNPTNELGINQDFVVSTISNSAVAWNSSTKMTFFKTSAVVDSNAQFGVADKKNSISFMYLPAANLVSGTVLFVDPKTTNIVEFDTFLNSYYNWGDAKLNPQVMDLQAVVTHELGHGLGLNDLYDSGCSTSTMYGRTNIGQTRGRVPQSGDILGLKQMYAVKQTKK